MRTNKKSHNARSAKSLRIKVLKRSKSKPAVTQSTTLKQPKRLKIRVPRSLNQYSGLAPEAQDKWNRITHVIAKMRSENKSLTEAAKEFAVSPKDVKNLAKSALRKQKNGRYVAKAHDRMLRILVVPSSEGLKEIPVRDSRTASKVAQYSDAVQRYLRTGDDSRLKKFRRVTLKDANGNRIPLLLDTNELNRQGSAGVLSFESLYGSAA